MRCILHIGTEKTGTTAIQKALEKEKKLLRDSNTVYPSVFHRGNDPKIVCYAMENHSMDMRKRRYHLDNDAAIEGFRDRLRRDMAEDLKESPETTIIVNEHLSRLREVGELERLKKFLLEFFDEVKIILYLRRQDKLMKSMYSTVVKVGGVRSNVFPTWPEHKAGDFTTFDYRRIVDLWCHVWGEDCITIRTFDRLLNGDVVADFMSFADIEVPDGKVFDRQNESISFQAIHTLREINKHIPREFRGNLGPMSGRLFPGKGVSVTRSEAAEFLSHFEEGNNYVARKYLSMERLFEPIGESEYPEYLDPSATTVSAPQMAEIFAKLWVEKVKQHREAVNKVAFLKDELSRATKKTDDVK